MYDLVKSRTPREWAKQLQGNTGLYSTSEWCLPPFSREEEATATQQAVSLPGNRGRRIPKGRAEGDGSLHAGCCLCRYDHQKNSGAQAQTQLRATIRCLTWPDPRGRSLPCDRPPRFVKPWMLLAGTTGFEPAISCLTGRYVRPATPRPHTD